MSNAVAYRRLEFMVPETEPLDWCRQVHLDRYRFACDLLDPTFDVLDLGCGAGYGAQMMAHETCGAVVGVDKSEIAIQYARDHYAAPNLTYVIADVCQPLRLGLFGLVVSFDVIEHLKSTTTYLRNVVNHLRSDDSVALISTPHSMRANNTTPASDFHHREYTLGEFREVLCRHFFVSELLMSMGMIAVVHKPTEEHRETAHNTSIGVPYVCQIEDELNRQYRRVADLEAQLIGFQAQAQYPPAVNVPARFLPLRAFQLWQKAGSRYLVHRTGLWLAWKCR